MYRDIPRIERHRLVPREVLTHRGWVAGLDRERQFPRHTSHHRGGGRGGALYDNGACRRERRCRCSPKVFRNRREASIRDVPLSLTGNRWRGIVNLIRPGCTMPSNAEKKKNHQAASNEWLDVTAIIVHFPPFLSGDATISLSRYIGAGYFYCYAVTHISRSDVLSERFISHVFDKTVYNGSFAVSLYFCAKRLFAEGYSFKGGI